VDLAAILSQVTDEQFESAAQEIEEMRHSDLYVRAPPYCLASAHAPSARTAAHARR
jgi:hypothetical protein